MLKFSICLIPCLICVAFFTLLERKVLGVIGLRMGPFKVSVGGFLQPIGDALKLINKETNNLSFFSYFFYYGSSFVIILCRFSLIFFLCFDPCSLNIKIGFLVLFLLLGFNSLNSILRGWRVYSKFSLLGRLRTVSQLVSYEILLYLCFFFFFFLLFSFDFSRVRFFPLRFFIFILPSLLFIWILRVLAELNRTPYDFSEGERELVRGFNVEFGSLSFTLIFLSEYGNIFFFIVLRRLLFFSSSSPFIFSLFFYIFVLWIRSVLPRYRFDKLIGLS